MSTEPPFHRNSRRGVAYAALAGLFLASPVAAAGTAVAQPSLAVHTTATVPRAIAVVAGVPVSAVEGSPFSGPVARFTDSDPNATPAQYTATIDWGDATGVTSGTVVKTGTGAFTINGTHTYAEEGTYHVLATLTNAAQPGFIATIGTDATVSDAPLTAVGIRFRERTGVPFTATVATFTDADPNAVAADFTAAIDWGDGTTSGGTVTANGSGGFNVSGDHTYARPGRKTVVVTITDAGGSTATAHSVAQVRGWC
ncbi:hypothetical protein [Streptomyces sp. NPDC002550]